jgi:uroporphyrinogen decarboxylase
VFSDLTYKNGLLFSPKFYQKSVLPYQAKFFGRAKEMGMKIIFHSDGYVGDLIPLLSEAGVDCIQPLEVRAGNDMREYMNMYPGRFSYMGNINADALTAGKDVIYNEISGKIPAVKDSRRYIYHSDHSIPDTVSLDNFKYALELVKELGKY